MHTLEGQRSIKDVLELGNAFLLSWANDKTICLWTSDGQLISVLEASYQTCNREVVIKWASSFGINPLKLFPDELLMKSKSWQVIEDVFIMYDPETGKISAKFYGDAKFTVMEKMLEHNFIVLGDIEGRVIMLRI